MKKKKTRSGAKARQRHDREDRAWRFKEWHRRLDPILMAYDIDLVEWRRIGGELTPVAVYEITRKDTPGKPHPNYLKAIIDRFEGRDKEQSEAIQRVASLLGVKAYIVLYTNEPNPWFCVYDWIRETWYDHDRPSMIKWIEGHPHP
jgi:hypothetical protein